MKTLSIINLHKAEIKKNQLANIKGGAAPKCVCAISAPYVVAKKSGGASSCLCDSSSSEAGIFNRKGD